MASKSSMWTLAVLFTLLQGIRSMPTEPSLTNQGNMSHGVEGWSPWSDWSPCSRTCDGGARFRQRRCLQSVCVGSATLYEICNMQQCPSPNADFRLEQCQKFNNVAYQGKFHSWIPHLEPKAPCSLHCKAADHSNLTVQFSAQLIDGTRCNEGSLGMCIDGICQPVGCDLQLGSSLTVDSCGVCGGNGSSCSHPHYQWKYAEDDGYCLRHCDQVREVTPFCVNPATDEKVPEHFCGTSTVKPGSKIQNCSETCTSEWLTEPWSPCTVTCGGGIRKRHVYCQRGSVPNKVADSECLSRTQGVKPLEEESCNQEECPAWAHGPWSVCSTTCGDGIQRRQVICRDAQGHSTNLCDPSEKPEGQKPCNDAKCPSQKTTPLPLDSAVPRGGQSEAAAQGPGRARGPFSPSEGPRKASSWAFNSQESWVSPRAPKSLGTPLPLDESDLHQVTQFSLFDDTDELEGPQQHLKQNPPLAAAEEDTPFSALKSSRIGLHYSQPVSTEPSFIVGEWSDCSVTCGQGIRKRRVKCQILMEFSRTVADLPDHECPGRKPEEIETCTMSVCSSARLWDKEQKDQTFDKSGEDRKVNSVLSAANEIPSAFRWKISGFTSCSASCLGGVQESVIQCFRGNDSQPVNPQLCSMTSRPDRITRTCNDVPCPPRWNVSDFSRCSRSCGGGVQTRQIQCIHEVARGGSNTLPVNFDLCPQPAPRTEQFCGMIDCPAQWKAGNWTKCSVSCGSGSKTRKVVCQQVLALGHVISKSTSACTGAKPAEVKACHLKACGQVKTKTPQIVSVEQNYVQRDVKKRVGLTIGGNATVSERTDVVLRCPVKNFDRRKLVWKKNNETIHSGSRFEINPKQLLVIRNISANESGIYSCWAGEVSAQLSISVRTIRDRELSADFQSKSPRGKERGKQKEKKPKLKSEVKSNRILEKLPLISTPDDDTADDEDDDSEGVILKNTLSGHLLPKMDDSAPLGKQHAVQKHKKQPAPELSKRKDQQDGSSIAEVQPVSADHIAGEKSKTGAKRKQKKSSGKGRTETSKYEWLITPWSKCSQTCGGSGFQVRGCQCLLRENNMTKSVESSLCHNWGLPPPVTVQKCGLPACPRWQTGAWTPCAQSRCFTWNTALQVREVTCRLPGGSDVLDPVLCDENDAPLQKRECYNENCRATWKMADWTKVPPKTATSPMTSPSTPLSTRRKPSRGVN